MAGLIAYLVERVSYRVVLVCLLSVPLTHAVALAFYKGLTVQSLGAPFRALRAKGRGDVEHTALILWECFLFPFTGGNRHVAFQLCSWGLWCLAAAMMVPVYLPHHGAASLPVIPNTHVDVISGAAAVAAFVGELFMLKAMLVYDARAPTSGPVSHAMQAVLGAKGAHAAAGSSGSSAAAPRKIVAPAVAVALVMVMGLALAATGAMLLLCLEYMPDLPSRVLYCCMALSCLTISASSTYGLGGHLRYSDGCGGSDSIESDAPASASVATAPGHAAKMKKTGIKPPRHRDSSEGQAQGQQGDGAASASGSMATSGCGSGSGTDTEGSGSGSSALHSREGSMVIMAAGAASGDQATPHSVHQLPTQHNSDSAVKLGRSDQEHQIIDGGGGGVLTGDGSAVLVDLLTPPASSHGTPVKRAEHDPGSNGSSGGKDEGEPGAAAAGGHTDRECGGDSRLHSGRDASSVQTVQAEEPRANMPPPPAAVVTPTSTAKPEGPESVVGAPAVSQSDADANADSGASHPQLRAKADEVQAYVAQHEHRHEHQDKDKDHDTDQAMAAGTAEAAVETTEASETEDVDVASWRFFQPFAGGTAFVSTQAVGWTLFSAAVVCVAELARRLVGGVAYCLRCWAISAGVLMCTTQLVLGLSLLTFRGRARAARLIKPIILHPRTAAATAWSAAAHALSVPMPVLLMYMPIHMFFAGWSLAFAFLPLPLALASLGAALVPYYIVTLRGEPAHTGCRQWPWLQRWFSRHVEASLKMWCGGVRVVVCDEHGDAVHTCVPGEEADGACHGDGDVGCSWDGAASNGMDGGDSDGCQDGSGDATSSSGGGVGKYVFGLHPHGFYPAGAGFLPLCPSFRRALPHVPRPVTLTASVVHYAPGVRDVAMWAGFRQVSRNTLRLALHECGSVLLCPGGQAELVYADKSYASDGVPEMIIYAGHKGFVREALLQGAALVPVLAIGETLTLRNAWHWQPLLRWTYKRLGFPFPLLLAGRWGITTLPLAGVGPLIYCVGPPIQPPPGLTPGQPVPEAVVDQLHAEFYACMQRMWAKHHAQHPYFSNARLRMVWSDRPGLTAAAAAVGSATCTAVPNKRGSASRGANRQAADGPAHPKHE